MEDLEIFIKYMTLDELHELRVIINRMIQIREDQKKLVDKLTSFKNK